MAEMAKSALDLFVASEAQRIVGHSQEAFSDDSVVDGVMRAQFVFMRNHRHFSEAIQEFSADPVLSRVTSRAGENDPMYLNSSGGKRLSPADLLDKTMQMAYIEIYCLQLPREQYAFAEIVASNLKKVRRSTKAETTFRVTGALTKLIEPDRTKRLDLRKALGRVYDARSQVVHGASLKGEDIDRNANRAIGVALQSLTELYSSRPELIPMDSGSRADALLLLSD